MSFVDKEYQTLNQGDSQLISASRRHQTKLVSQRSRHYSNLGDNKKYSTLDPNLGNLSNLPTNVTSIYKGDQVRQLPKLRDGVHDEWKALIDLQNRDRDIKDQNKKEDDSNKKKAYLGYLQDEMVIKQRKALDNKEQLQKDAQRIHAITVKELNDQKDEQVKLSEKRQLLNQMNLKQIDEYKQMLARKKAEDNSFHLANNAGVIEKEKQDKLNFILKQKKYAQELMSEIGQRKEMKNQQQVNDKELREKEKQMTLQIIEKEKIREANYKQKFDDFSKKYEKKNEWFQQNIIQPQIEKHLNDFDREKQYDQKYIQNKIQNENIENLKKKNKERDIHQDVQYQIMKKQEQKRDLQAMKQQDNEKIKKITYEDEQYLKNERSNEKIKKFSYRQKLDQQVESLNKIKALGQMNQNEIQLNRKDLGRFLEGENQIISMIPGINSLTDRNSREVLKQSITKSQQSINTIVQKQGSLLHPSFVETQKRLQQFGYNKDISKQAAIGEPNVKQGSSYQHDANHAYQMPKPTSSRRQIVPDSRKFNNHTPMVKNEEKNYFNDQQRGSRRSQIADYQLLSGRAQINANRNSIAEKPSERMLPEENRSRFKSPFIQKPVLPVNTKREQSPGINDMVNKGHNPILSPNQYSGAAGARSGVLKNAANNIFGGN